MRYAVQMASIQEIQVEADDELEAEREAFRKLSPQQQDCVVSLCVLKDREEAGALREDPANGWEFAKRKFHAARPEWLKGG